MKKKGKIFQCTYCGKDLYQFPSRIKRAIERKSVFYCNFKCKGLFLKGKHRSLSTEFKKGKNHPKWKGGVTKDKQYLQWLKHRRRYVKVEGNHTFKEWEELKKKRNYTCQICKKKEPEIKLTEDHIIPISKGGTNYISNIQPLCRGCNSKKWAT